ncbi:hypothetical protein KAT92_02415 [Candidatus Babeliales bacterium]|nr:hypothetical protein [Candidatus Babeliales bacterium]
MKPFHGNPAVQRDKTQNSILSDTEKRFIFYEKCRNVLLSMRDDEFYSSGKGGLIDFIELLQGYIKPDYSCLLWIKANDELKIGSPQKRRHSDENFNWNQIRENECDLPEIVKRLEDSTSRFYATYNIEISLTSRGEDPLVITPLLCVFKLPKLYSRRQNSNHVYVAMLFFDYEEIFYEKELNLQIIQISSLIDTWAWSKNHYRLKLKDYCSKALMSAQKKEKIWENLEGATKDLACLLTVSEVTTIAWAAFLAKKDDEEEIPPILRDTLGKDLGDWQQQAPPNWPPDEKYKPPHDMVKTLVFWCRWRNQDSGVIHSLR